MLIKDETNSKHKSLILLRSLKSIASTNLVGKYNFRTILVTAILSVPVAIGMHSIASKAYSSLPVKYKLAISKSYVAEIYKSGISPIIPINYIYSFFNTPDKLGIDIKFLEYKKLEDKRKEGLEYGKLLQGENDYVQAVMTHNKEKYRISLRLKGDHLDHIVTDQWSFRVKVRGNKSIYGMKKFSLQAPRTRNYIYEWFYHKLLQREGLPYLRYKFASLSINGKDMGIYALEEHFDKYLIENNKEREGPVLKFSESDFFNKKLSYRTKLSGENHLLTREVDVFEKGIIIQDELRRSQYNSGKYLLENYINGKLRTRDVFDIDALAKFLALVDISGGKHGIAWHNLRFYFNPILFKLIPIGFDSMAGNDNLNIQSLNIESNPLGFFDDDLLAQQYTKYLNKYSSIQFIDGLLIGLSPSIKEKLQTLHRTYPYTRFNKEYIYSNARFIRNKLKSFQPVSVRINKFDKLNLTLKIENHQLFPIELINFRYDNKTIFFSKAQTRLRKSNPLSTKRSLIVDMPLKDGLTNLEDIQDGLISYRIRGLNKIRTAKVKDGIIFNSKPTNLLAADEVSNLTNYKFLIKDDIAKTIKIKTGSWEISEPIFIPSGYKVEAGPGVTIDLKKDAFIHSRSPIYLTGSKKSPILIKSSEYGQGLIIVQAKTRSIINNVYFENLRSPKYGSWSPTGAVTFYKSPVSITNARFTNNNSEDGLNIIRSSFKIDNIIFTRTFSDAIDIDYSNGTISNTKLSAIGNDAIDISGSQVYINGITINKAGDKAISVGERSSMFAKNVSIKQSAIGIASKDLSNLEGININISKTNLPLAIYQKKAEYGPASISLSNSMIEGWGISGANNPNDNYLVERYSSLSVNGKRYASNSKNVFKLLYPVEK